MKIGRVSAGRRSNAAIRSMRGIGYFCCENAVLAPAKRDQNLVARSS
jgi:hypothetical protein